MTALVLSADLLCQGEHGILDGKVIKQIADNLKGTEGAMDRHSIATTHLGDNLRFLAETVQEVIPYLFWGTIAVCATVALCYLLAFLRSVFGRPKA